MMPKKVPRISRVDVDGDECLLSLAFPAPPEAHRFGRAVAGLLEQDVDIDIHPSAWEAPPEWDRRGTSNGNGSPPAPASGPPDAEDDDELAREIRHDLRTPLNLVSSYLELLEDEHGSELSPEAQSFVDGALDGARRLGSMIDGLGDGAVASRGCRDARTADLGEALDEAVANLRRELDAAGIDIRRGPLPAVHADAGDIVRVFQNLLSNAIAYQDEGGWIQVAAADVDGSVTVAVTDGGPGVPEAERTDIFSPGRRGSAAQGTDGSGMGLAICRRIVEDHGGTVGVDDAPQGGATFWVRLPQAPAEAGSTVGTSTT